MGKYVYLFELDSVRKTDEEIVDAVCKVIRENVSYDQSKENAC